jgi:hypothetical protein
MADTRSQRDEDVSTSVSNFVNSLGLFFDIAGAVLLYLYGLPENISPTGSTAIVLEKKDEQEIAKAACYKRRGRLGLILLIVGFLLQFVSNFL